VYGLAFAYMELGDVEQAGKHFPMMMDMSAPEEMRALARNGLREIAVLDLKSHGPRLDISNPPGDACPAVPAREDRFGAGASMHHVRRIQAVRAGNGHQGGPERGVGDGGEVGLLLIAEISKFYWCG